MNQVPTAYVVDDEESIRSLWEWLLASNGIAVRTFGSAAAFIQSYRSGDAGCLVLDVRLPGMSGPELQDYLRREGIGIPIVFMSAHGDVRTAVNAMKGGAVDFIQKPFDYREALAIVRRAFERDVQERSRKARRAQLAERLAALTERERGVLQRIVEGKANKVIAAELDISVKTVEAHRAKVMEKMAVDSVAELVQRIIGFSLMEAPRG
ncbi:MAG TPA: response regulator [Burkholderiales bacterium]|jgi:two-component system response regulator TtrR